MRLNRSTKNRGGTSPISLSMTGMIDVVFLLLIFFLVTTSFDQPTRSIVTPVVTDRRIDRVRQSDDQPLMLTVYPDGERIGYQMAGVRSTDEGKIRELLMQIDSDDESILIKVTGGISFQSAMSAFDMCRTCGHRSVAWYPVNE